MSADFGCESKLKDAALHAVIECLRTAVPVFYGNITPEEWEIKPIKGNPRWHFWMAQKTEAKDFLIKNLLNYDKTADKTWKVEKISIDNAKFREVATLASTVPNLPLKVVQAYSEVMLEPQFGEVVADRRLMRRLEIFAGGHVVPEIKVPHFYD